MSSVEIAVAAAPRAIALETIPFFPVLCRIALALAVVCAVAAAYGWHLAAAAADPWPARFFLAAMGTAFASGAGIAALLKNRG